MISPILLTLTTVNMIIYKEILEQNLALSKQAGMESFDCLELMKEDKKH